MKINLKESAVMKINISTDDMEDINHKAQPAINALDRLDSAIYCALGCDNQHELVRLMTTIHGQLCFVLNELGATYVEH